MHLILIARVSDIEQRKALPGQKLKLQEYASTIDPKAEYYEFDESAHKDIRKKFAKLVEHIRSFNETVAVVFCKVDRYTRDSSQEEVRTMNNLVKTGKIELHFPGDNLFITKDSPATDLFRLGIGMVLSKYYSDSISDNVKRRFHQLLHDGIWIGYAPIGYQNVHKGSPTKPTKEIELDETRSPFIKTIFEKRAAGLPYEVIANEMNELGLRSKSGKVLNKGGIEKICRNPWYYGQMMYMGKLYKHKYPTLIDKQLFDKVQLIRDERQKQHTKYRSLPFIFNRLARCKCGCMMSSFYARNNVYMKCSQAKGHCDNVNTAESLILPEINQLLDHVALPEEAFKIVVDEVKEQYGKQQDHWNKQVEETRSEYDKVSSQLKAVTYERLDSVTNGKGISDELFTEIVDELTSRQQELNHRLSILTDSNSTFLTTASHLLSLAQQAKSLYQGGTIAQKQQLLQFLLPNVVIYQKTLSYSIKQPYKSFVTLNKKAPKGLNDTNWCG